MRNEPNAKMENSEVSGDRSPRTFSGPQSWKAGPLLRQTNPNLGGLGNMGKEKNKHVNIASKRLYGINGVLTNRACSARRVASWRSGVSPTFGEDAGVTKRRRAGTHPAFPRQVRHPLDDAETGRVQQLIFVLTAGCRRGRHHYLSKCCRQNRICFRTDSGPALPALRYRSTTLAGPRYS